MCTMILKDETRWTVYCAERNLELECGFEMFDETCLKETGFELYIERCRAIRSAINIKNIMENNSLKDSSRRKAAL